MYEVEVKARLRDRQAVMKKLEDLGCKFGEELHQIDHVFTPRGTPGPRSPLGTPVIRVRKQNEKYIFTLKISQSNHQDSIERELEIKDGKMMIAIFKLMQWEEMPDVDKVRIKTKYKGMEIVLDKVKHLGDFIEVERIVKNKDHESRKKIQNELYSFLETLGVEKKDHIIDGKYDIMMYEKVYGK
jgi:predicted adenylyl cyclase CyaB